MMQDVSIVMCGAAGQGIQTVEQLLVGIFKNAGYNVYATKEYESRVRGGSNSTELRISDSRVTAMVDRIDIMIPFDKAAVEHLRSRIDRDTLVIADQDSFSNSSLNLPQEPVLLPFKAKAVEIGSRLYTNVVAVGAVTGLFDVDPAVGEAILEQKFGSKGADLVRENIEALHAGNALGIRMREERELNYLMSRSAEVGDEILLNGNQAVALGAIAGGCNFISAYPMSPSTGVLEMLSELSHEFGIVVDQAEDEIAAMNKAVAAWFAGARAIVSTSGGGFDLMTEGLSMAGIMESPLVVHLAQRPGPATGLPTRTAQEDLNLAVYAGHGEFCRLVYAPGTIDQAFKITQRAFNIADRYQVPVFILTDQDFVDSYYNIPSLDLNGMRNEHHFVETDEGYMRYRLTKNGLSPRGVPGLGSGLVRLDSDEHDERGHITEDLEHTRPAMVEKRLHQRRELLTEVLEPPEQYPEGKATSYVVCWGSNRNVVKEALDILPSPGLAMLHFHQVFPLHPAAKEKLAAAERTIILENNATGQFANLLKIHADHDIPSEGRHLRYSGKPWTVEEVVDILRKEGF